MLQAMLPVSLAPLPVVTPALLLLLMLLLTPTGAAQDGTRPRGRQPAAAPAPATVALRGKIQGHRPGSAPILVHCFAHPAPRDGEQPGRLSKHDFYHRQPDLVVLADDATFEIDDLVPGHYSLVAFQDLDLDGRISYRPPEPLGWYTSKPAGFIEPLAVSATTGAITIALRSITPFPDTLVLEGFNGALRHRDGIATVRLWGSAVERGRAHGALLGRQILDFFEFYILEDKFASAARYQSTFYRFLEQNFAYPTAFLTEVDAVLAGMRATGLELRIASLDREFDRTDLCAINAYIESRAMRSSCTQFAFWGRQTATTDVAGGLIAGRNMDGEIDLRKATVAHFVVFAIDQQDASRKRFLNLMWPGFVGTITGINEDGLYSMENAGGSGPGPVEDSLVPISWTQRFILENVNSTVSPQAVENIIDAHRGSGGGSCGPGCIILFATPYRGQPAPAFVYEGDRFGGRMRLPTEVRPNAATQIMASNHFRSYGVATRESSKVFGHTASFSSRWRYEAGSSLVEAWTRRDHRIGTAEMVRLLQTVAHGSTEHSIIFRANQMTLDIAVDDLAPDLWDAPFHRFRSFRFADFFAE
jgi:uncharacterized protein (DUF2141 family)